MICLFLAGAAFLTTAVAQTDGNPAKTRALALRDELTVLSRTKDVEQSAWDAVGTQIDGYQKEYGVTEATSNNVALLRKFQLSLAKRFPDQARKPGVARSACARSRPGSRENGRRTAKSDSACGRPGRPIRWS